MKTDELNVLFAQHKKELSIREKKRKAYALKMKQKLDKRLDYEKKFSTLITDVFRPEMKKFTKIFISNGCILAIGTDLSAALMVAMATGKGP